MSKLVKIVALAGVFAMTVVGGSSLYAHESDRSGDSMMGSGMMGHGGMMEIMGQMSEMIEDCKKMMQSMHQNGSEQPGGEQHQNMPGMNQAPDRNG